MDQVRDEILGADVVLAVLTGANPNVMFELGLALESAARPAVLISNVAADILPFDVRQHRVLTYGDLGDPAQFREQLTEAIRRTLELPPRVSLRQPPLDLQRVEPRHGARFYYGARWAAFVGRDRELEALQRFVDDSGPFRWWMVIGAGGLGKSRLALEFALRLGGRWRAGFLAQEEWDWGSWRPTRPTLLIADYVSARVEDVRRLALALARRRDLAFPVRLLLLERDFQELQMGERRDAAWYQAFLGVGGDRALITASRHDAPPLQLDPLDVADVEAMVTSFLRTELAAATARQVAASLMQVDPLGRSLSALLMAESPRAAAGCAAGQSPGTC